jgi:hypothetical protein
MKNGGKLETAQQIADHESPRTTKLHHRRKEEISLDAGRADSAESQLLVFEWAVSCYCAATIL